MEDYSSRKQINLNRQAKCQKFVELAVRNLFENLAHTECANAPIVGALDILLQAEPGRYYQNI